MPNPLESLYTIEQLQQNFGVSDYSKLQVNRRKYYSYQVYPTAGTQQLTFFTTAIGGSVTASQTNMLQAGSFGNVDFIPRLMGMNWKCKTATTTLWSGLDSTTTFADFFGGLFQAGELEYQINGKPYLQLPVPFLYAQPLSSPPQVWSAGITALTLTEGTPNTLATYVTPQPDAQLSSYKSGYFKLDPARMILAQETFQFTLNYPSGLVPAIFSEFNDSTNPLYVGVTLDGYEIRPL